MRTREEMLKDANTARRSYAMLTEPEDMMLVRLGWDVLDLLASLAEKDAEIERLQLAARRFSRKIAGLPE